MNFDVRVPDDVKAKILSWNLPDKIVEEIFERFVHELAERPLDVLRDIKAPFPMKQYSFSSGLKSSADKFTFVFPVRVDSDQKTIVVLEAFQMSFRKIRRDISIPVVD